MVKLVLRDDDCNYFTKIKDIEDVYREIPFFPISFAVVPTVMDVSTIGACSDTKGNTVPRFLGDNIELCDWLKLKYHKGKCDILMHGITHSYVTKPKRLAEMEWRTSECDLTESIGNAKKILEELFQCSISVFVAPSNKISRGCLNAVTKNGLNFSGIVPLSFNQNLTFQNIRNYFKRWFFRIRYKYPYPAVLKYSDHAEINVCIPVSLDYLKGIYGICKKKNMPMAINVHYWDLRDNPSKKQMIIDFVKFAVKDGAIPSRMSDCLI